MLWYYVRVRRCLVNGVLGAMPACILVTDWNTVPWAWLITAMITGALLFHYVSVQYARNVLYTRWLAFFVATTGFVWVLYVMYMLGATDIHAQIATKVIAGCAGEILVCVYWMRANGVSIYTLLGPLPDY
ncbi:MAG: hypothetical protein HYT30_00765 [Parcubacteria group bacterium]|nr:hypothetical protein [Parcubacteria group bacterium]